MPTEKIISNDNEIETPRGPQSSGGIPDRKQEDGIAPPIINPGDEKNLNDPALPLSGPIVNF